MCRTASQSQTDAKGISELKAQHDPLRGLGFQPHGDAVRERLHGRRHERIAKPVEIVRPAHQRDRIFAIGLLEQLFDALVGRIGPFVRVGHLLRHGLGTDGKRFAVANHECLFALDPRREASRAPLLAAELAGNFRLVFGRFNQTVAATSGGSPGDAKRRKHRVNFGWSEQAAPRQIGFRPRRRWVPNSGGVLPLVGIWPTAPRGAQRSQCGRRPERADKRIGRADTTASTSREATSAVVPLANAGLMRPNRDRHAGEIRVMSPNVTATTTTTPAKMPPGINQRFDFDRRLFVAVLGPTRPAGRRPLPRQEAPRMSLPRTPLAPACRQRKRRSPQLPANRERANRAGLRADLLSRALG